VGVRVGVAVYNFYSSIKTVGATVCGLWTLEWAWHIAEILYILCGVGNASFCLYILSEN